LAQPQIQTFFIASLLTVIWVNTASAQMVDAAGKRIDIFMVEEAPVLDGILDDDAWAFASVIDDLHEVVPDEFTEPSERSIVYVVYTKDALYVAARMYDREPDKISAQVLRQGDFSFGEDSFDVLLDPFNNGRSGYLFDLTANGVRNQALYEKPGALREHHKRELELEGDLARRYPY
jgi:hypothetical protein